MIFFIIYAFTTTSILEIVGQGIRAAVTITFTIEKLIKIFIGSQSTLYILITKNKKQFAN